MTRASTRKGDRRSERGREDPRKSERASRVLFISSLWYNSRFLFSFTCKRHVVKLISRYSTYASLHPSRVSTPRRAAFIISLDFPLSLPSSAVPPPYTAVIHRATLCSPLQSVSFLSVLSYAMFYFAPLSLFLRTSAPHLPRAYIPPLPVAVGWRAVTVVEASGTRRYGRARGKYYSKQDLHFYDAAIFY